MNLSFGILLLSVLIASFSQILLKKSSRKSYASVIKEYGNPYVIFGYGMLFFSLLLTILAYRKLDFTTIPVIESSGYGVVMILSYFFFGEKITPRKVIGMACILTGILVYYL